MRRFGLILALLPACVVAKSVGDDPETAGVDGGEGDPSGSTSTTTGASSVSATSTAGGTGTVTPSYEECGVNVVPVEPGGPSYTDIIECEEGCTITIHSGAPTGWSGDQAIADCLCMSIDCGGWNGNSGGGEEGPIPESEVSTSTTTGPLDCGYDPPPNAGPGEYSSRCVCETCEFVFEDISEEDVLALDEETCECLCQQGDCGGQQGYGEATSAGSETGVPDTSGTSG